MLRLGPALVRDPSKNRLRSTTTPKHIVPAQILPSHPLYRGELPLADIAGFVEATEPHGRIVAALMEKGVLASDNPRASLRLVAPATLASRWMPGLFPEKTGAGRRGMI
jgi:hypothetical protein